MDLNAPLSSVKGVGPKTAEQFDAAIDYAIEQTKEA